MMIGNTIHTENMSDNTIVGSESISFHLTLLLGSVTREWLIWETSSPAVFSRSNFVPFNSTIAVTITLTILIKGTWSTFECSKLFIRQCRSLKPIFQQGIHSIMVQKGLTVATKPAKSFILQKSNFSVNPIPVNKDFQNNSFKMSPI